MTALSKPEMVAEHIRCQDSFVHYLSRYGVVKNTERRSGGAVTFKLWPHIADAAEVLQDGKSLILGKSRQLGASWLLANYDAWSITFSKDFRILSISMGQRESTSLLEKVRFCLDSHPDWMKRSRTKDNETRIELGNGSGIVALPSTPNAGRSETASLVQTDEFAFHEYAGENFAAYRNAIADGGQHLIVTTGNGPSGMFHSMWHDENPEFPYEKRFWPWSIRPDRDQEWYEREKAAFLAGGEKHPLLFIRENPSTIEEMFTAFFGLVYEDFTPSHVKEPVTPYEKCTWRIAAVDPGQGDPAAVAIIGEDDSGQAHLYGPEFYQPGVTTAGEIYEYLTTWYRKSPLHAVVVDGAEGTLIATLNAWFLRDFGREGVVRAANKERGLGIGHVASRLKLDTFSLDPACSHAKREFQSYRWKERKSPGESDPYATSTPIDHHADLLDCIRYALVFIAQFCSGVKRVEIPTPAYEHEPKTEMKVKPDAKGRWIDPLSKESGTVSHYQNISARMGPDYRRRSGPAMRRR